MGKETTSPSRDTKIKSRAKIVTKITSEQGFQKEQIELDPINDFRVFFSHPVDHPLDFTVTIAVASFGHSSAIVIYTQRQLRSLSSLDGSNARYRQFANAISSTKYSDQCATCTRQGSEDCNKYERHTNTREWNNLCDQPENVGSRWPILGPYKFDYNEKPR